MKAFTQFLFLCSALLAIIGISLQTAEAQVDFAVTEITSPTTTPQVFSSRTTISFTLKNLSSSPRFNGGSARYRVNGGSWSAPESPCPETTMGAGTSVACSFSSNANADFFKTGTYTLEVNYFMPDDFITANNSLSIQVTSSALASSTQEIATFPYSEGFESGPGNWTAFGWNNRTIFALGTPAKNRITSAGEGSASWITDLSAPTQSDTRTQVISPVFDFRNFSVVDFRMKAYWENSGDEDGARLQYSTDGGTVWTDVGAVAEPTNWYNNPNPYALNEAAGDGAGWSGYVTAGSDTVEYYTSGTGEFGYLTTGTVFGSDGWVDTRHRFPGGAKTKLRVIFASTGQDDGFAFDAVSINSGLTASQTDTLLVDADSDGRVDVGDRIGFTATIVNPTNSPISNLEFNQAFTNSGLALVVGSVTTSRGTVITGNAGGDTSIKVRSIPSLAAGSTITVTFSADVVSLSESSTQVCLQASITADEFGSITALTNDPDTAAFLDPTCRPAFLDADNDGVSDTNDACPGFPDSQDNDSDTVPDACDECPFEDDTIDSQPNGTPDCAEPEISVGNDGTCNSGSSDCYKQRLQETLCVGVNGFHSQINILTVQNKLGSSLPVTVRYFNQAGAEKGKVGTAIQANTKQDFYMSALGLQPDTIGSACVTTASGVGAWVGGLAIYKPNLRPAAAANASAAELYDYALYYPMVNPFQYSASVPLNTYHLGTDPAALVSNYISLADGIRGDGKPLTGLLHVYNDVGVEIGGGGLPISIPDGSRQDYDVHRILTGDTNTDRIGSATFVADPLMGGGVAKFYMTSARYFYDCFTVGCSDFLAAFVVLPRIPSNAPMAGSASTTNGEFAIAEALNPTGSDTNFAFQVNNAEAVGVLGNFNKTLASNHTQHFIFNQISNFGYVPPNSKASAKVTFPVGKGSVWAVHYKIDASGKMQYAYAAPYTGASFTYQTSFFNSFIGHGNLTEVINLGSDPITVTATYRDFTGAQVGNPEVMNIPGNTANFYTPPLPSSTYGPVTFTSTSPNFTAQNYISRSGEYAMCVPAL